MTVKCPSLSRRLRYGFWSLVVELVCWCGYAGSRPYFWALARMTRQIDWRA